jgi:hypothetical protein
LKTEQPYRTKLDRGNDTVLTTGSTPLVRAAKAADIPAMRLLLDKGADAKLSTRNGVNPLMVAAGVGTREEDTTGRRKVESDAVEAVALCLAAGVDVNAADTRGQTALHGAALQGLDSDARCQGQARIHTTRCRAGAGRWRRLRWPFRQASREHGRPAAPADELTSERFEQSERSIFPTRRPSGLAEVRR